VKRLVALLLLLIIAGLALAHAEPVQAVTTLKETEDALEAEARLVGEVSTLPIRGAVLELALYKETPELKALMPNGVLSRTGSAKLPAPEIAATKLTEDATGVYRGKLEKPAPGRYVMVILDTTFKGEATMTGSPITIPLRPNPLYFTGTLPETKTPNRYLIYALAGLAVPAIIGIVFVFLNRAERSAA